MDFFSTLDTTNLTIVTPNRRLAATLLNQFNHYQSSIQKKTWERLDILPFSSWIIRLWKTYCFQTLAVTPLILTSQQEHVLWEDILSQSPSNETLLQLSATAELAKSAWATLKQWRMSIHAPELSLTEDSAAFQRWAIEFEQRCQQHHWLDTYTLIDSISEKISSQSIPLPTHLVLAGFTEYTPQQTHLISLCESQHITVTHYSTTASKSPTLQRIELTDETDEIRQMAAFAKSLYQSSHSLKIGCVIPNLDSIRDKVLRIFTQVFSDPVTLTLNPLKLPFNISAGKPLSSYPIIQSALQCLQFINKSLSEDDIHHLLHTPFIGEAEAERCQRAQFDAELHNHNVIIHSLSDLLNAHKNSHLAQHCPKLYERLKQIHDHISLTDGYQPVSDWITIFMQILTLFGWPGERSVNSQEYQVIQRWLELLEEFSALNPILNNQSYQQALYYLTKLTAKTIFQIQSPEAPIQLLGLLEAADIPFDYLWIMGLDDSAWPPAAKPNPLIPLRLQKDMGMPHANAERELHYSTLLTNQLKQSAHHIIFSYSEKKEDNEQRPSALILDATEIEVTDLTLEPLQTPTEIIFASKKVDTLIDDQAPAIQPNEPMRGGVKLFKNQAICPFKAFAENRLHAYPIEDFTLGLHPKERGIIVHQLLDSIWKTIQTSEELHRLDTDTLSHLIHEKAMHAIESITHQAINSSRHLVIELARLEKLALSWLEIEKKRDDFKVVSQEQSYDVTIGPISIALRVDRIDELPDGKYIIIDYKTGKNSEAKSWFSNRPEEPQLPIYCLINPEHTVGIAFANLHVSKLQFIGNSSEKYPVSFLKSIDKESLADNDSWEKQILCWQTTLEKLSHDFFNGVAIVDPKNETTCKHCQLKPFCRIHEKVETL